MKYLPPPDVQVKRGDALAVGRINPSMHPPTSRYRKHDDVVQYALLPCIYLQNIVHNDSISLQDISHERRYSMLHYTSY